MEGRSSLSDFTIRCLPEDAIFSAQRVKLTEGSEVFGESCHSFSTR